MDTVKEVNAFYGGYRGEKKTYGFSEQGLPLCAMKTGGGKCRVIVQCAMHAREYVTAALGLKLLRDEDIKRCGVTVWVLPLTNPDGVKIVQQGVGWLAPRRAERIRAFMGDKSLSLYKANADGVDLNVNFNARWGTGAQNVFQPASENYVGPFCESAAEVRALAAFTKSMRPHATVSLHTKGNVLYWRFYQQGDLKAKNLALARAFSGGSGYPLGDAGRSAGGYKDWCIEKLGIPALTVEVGADSMSHPIGRRYARRLYPPVKNGLCAMLRALREET